MDWQSIGILTRVSIPWRTGGITEWWSFILSVRKFDITDVSTSDMTSTGKYDKTDDSSCVPFTRNSTSVDVNGPASFSTKSSNFLGEKSINNIYFLK